MTLDMAISELSTLWERFNSGMGWRDGNFAEALEIAMCVLEREMEREANEQS